MHIGFISSHYPFSLSTRVGGIGTSIKNLSKALIAQGHHATVFVYGQSQDAIFQEEGVKIYTIKNKKVKGLSWYFTRKKIERLVQQVILEAQIDIIEAPDWTGISAFMRFSVPLVIRLNGSDGYFCHLENRTQKWFNGFLEQNALQQADAIISVSTFTAEQTKAIFNIKKDIVTLFNSVDVDEFRPIEVEVDTNEILYFGAIIRKKGVLDLAHVFNTLVEDRPETTLLLIGNDTVDVFTKSSTLALFYSILSDEARARVKHIPGVPYTEIKHYIAKAAVVVLPSYAEAFPMTWLETLAMEKPLVSSNIGWAKELMIDGKTGYMVTPDDHNVFAEKVIALLEDEGLRVNMGSYARAHVKRHFSTAIITKQNIDYYHSLIQG